MSHFTVVKTLIRDQVRLEDTLRQLHYDFKVGENLAIRGYSGARATAQVVMDTGGSYDIGFQRQEDQSFAVCADWWGVEGNSSIRQQSFLNEVNQTYAHLAVRSEVLEQGYIIEREEVLQNGEIELVVVERF